jgi:glycine cleavage system H lipoate-binding protein
MTSTRSDQNDRSQCLWMQAGVVRRKFCQADYQCVGCRFDQTLRRVAAANQELRRDGAALEGRRGRIVYWKDKLRELPAWRRPCLHAMKGRIGFRACLQDYRCMNCEFDQYFNDQYTVHAVVRPVDVLNIKGFKLPQGVYLHPGHSWLKIEEGPTVRVGVDDFALKLLGPSDRIEAPLMGKEVQQDRADISLHRAGHRAAVLSPISGVVTAINPRLRETGRFANQDPYAEGWVMQIHSNRLRAELRNLMIGSQAREYLDGEIERLYDAIEQQTGPLAADGGFLGDDIFGSLPSLGWDRLTRLFLRSA